MPQIHSPYSSQLDLTVAALPTINIAKGFARGQQGPLTMTLIFNDDNKPRPLCRAQAHTHTHTHTPHYTSTEANSISRVCAQTEVYRVILHIWRAGVTSRDIQCAIKGVSFLLAFNKF